MSISGIEPSALAGLSIKRIDMFLRETMNLVLSNKLGPDWFQKYLLPRMQNPGVVGDEKIVEIYQRNLRERKGPRDFDTSFCNSVMVYDPAFSCYFNQSFLRDVVRVLVEKRSHMAHNIAKGITYEEYCRTNEIMRRSVKGNMGLGYSRQFLLDIGFTEEELPGMRNLQQRETSSRRGSAEQSSYGTAKGTTNPYDIYRGKPGYRKILRLDVCIFSIFCLGIFLVSQYRVLMIVMFPENYGDTFLRDYVVFLLLAMIFVHYPYCYLHERMDGMREIKEQRNLRFLLSCFGNATRRVISMAMSVAGWYTVAVIVFSLAGLLLSWGITNAGDYAWIEDVCECYIPSIIPLFIVVFFNYGNNVPIREIFSFIRHNMYFFAPSKERMRQ